MYLCNRPYVSSKNQKLTFQLYLVQTSNEFIVIQQMLNSIKHHYNVFFKQ